MRSRKSINKKKFILLLTIGLPVLIMSMYIVGESNKLGINKYNYYNYLKGFDKEKNYMIPVTMNKDNISNLDNITLNYINKNVITNGYCLSFNNEGTLIILDKKGNESKEDFRNIISSNYLLNKDWERKELNVKKINEELSILKNMAIKKDDINIFDTARVGNRVLLGLETLI